MSLPDAEKNLVAAKTKPRPPGKAFRIDAGEPMAMPGTLAQPQFERLPEGTMPGSPLAAFCAAIVR